MLDFLYELMYKSGFWILLGSLLWGIASVVLSPCHWTTIPILVGWINKNEKDSKSVFTYSSLFSLGIFVSIILLGVITGVIGRILGDLGRFGDIFMIAILIYFALVIMDVIPVRFSFGGSQNQFSKKSAFLNGLLFGTGLGPCTFAFMAPVLGVLLGTIQENIPFSLGIVLLFSLGHCGIIVILTMFSESILNVFKGKVIAGKLVKFITGLILLGYSTYKIYLIFS